MFHHPYLTISKRRLGNVVKFWLIHIRLRRDTSTRAPIIGQGLLHDCGCPNSFLWYFQMTFLWSAEFKSQGFLCALCHQFLNDFKWETSKYNSSTALKTASRICELDYTFLKATIESHFDSCVPDMIWWWNI